MLGFKNEVINESLLDITTSTLILTWMVYAITNDPMHAFTTMGISYIGYGTLVMFCKLVGREEEN